MKLIALPQLLRTLLLLAIAIPLVGLLPASVLAQPVTAEDTTTDAPEVVDSEIVTLESEASSTAAYAVPPAARPYKIEQLPDQEVFGDFVIGPGRFDLELAPGESRTVELIVSNRMGEGKTFSFDTEDTTGSDTGEKTIKLLGEERGPYTLKDYISVPHDEFYLEHSERARIPVTISIPANAQPGGRYGSLLVTMVSNPNDSGAVSGAKPASVIVSRIATLFFIKTPGEIDYDMQLQSLSTVNDQTFFTAGPIKLLLEHENFGSVHTTPYGRITVTNLLGEEVGVQNLEPWFVMPESIRTREIEWNREFLIGRYTATAEINRGYDDIVDEMSFSFWVIPWKLLVGVFVVIFLVFYLIRFIFSRFEFKRKT